LGKDLVDVVDQPGAEDDLQLVAGNKLPLDQIHVLNFVTVGLVVILQHDAQTGGAVGTGHNVVLSAYQLHQLFDNGKVAFLIVLFAHDLPPRMLR